MLILIFMLILMLIFLLMLSSLFVPTLVSVFLEGCVDSDIFADAKVVCFTNLGLSCPRGLWLSSYGADDQIEPIQWDHRQHQLIMVKLESKYIEHCAVDLFRSRWLWQTSPRYIHVACWKKKEKPDWWKQRRKVRWVRIYRPLWSAALWSRWRSPHLFWIMMIRKQTLMPNMAFDVFCIFWEKCEATNDSQCPAGYSHNRASIYMTGREIAITKN